MLSQKVENLIFTLEGAPATSRKKAQPATSQKKAQPATSRKKAQPAKQAKKGKSSDLSIDEKIHLITRNLEPQGEIMNKEKAIPKMRKILKEKGTLKIYWGTAPTGAPHVAYFPAMAKIRDFLAAGCEVVILLADLHAFLDALKTPWDRLTHRVNYYKACVTSMLEALNVPIDKLKFVRGTDFQLSKEYTIDVYKLSSQTSIKKALKAGSDVVKQLEGGPIMAKLAPALYPLLQALDEKHLGVDIQFGGLDQRKIFAYASDNLKHYLQDGTESKMHLMNPMVPGLQGSKMSASNKYSKIDLLDSKKDVEVKFNKAKMVGGQVQDNGVLQMCKFVVFPVFLKDGEKFVVESKAEFSTFQELEDAFAKEEISCADLKRTTAKYFNRVMDKIRKDFEAPERANLRGLAYPEEKKKEEKGKPKVVEKSALKPLEKFVYDFFKKNGDYPPKKDVQAFVDPVTGKKTSNRFAKRAIGDVKKMISSGSLK